MLILLLLILTVTDARAQITCSAMGTSVYCSYPDGSSQTATELRPGQGVVTDSRGNLEPYAILPQARSIAPGFIQPLTPLPTLDVNHQSGLGLSPIMPGLDPLVPTILLGE